MKKIIISTFLVFVMAFYITGCKKVACGPNEVKGNNLMEKIEPNKISGLEDLGEHNSKMTDFAVRLFNACNEDGKNTLISPISVYSALAMTTNGADAGTLEQMEKVLGMTAEEMNLYFYSYMNKLPQTEKYKLSLANSIWFTDDDRFTVNKDFLQINGDYYGSDIYKAPFSTETLNNINEWVKNKTDGMIPKILEEISDGAVMYLVNALAFNAEWAEIFDEDHVREGVFTDENGNEQNVEFMYGKDHVYYEDEYATGFMKYYVDCKYGFVALIPNEGVSVADYVKTLNGESLNNMLNNPVHTTVYTSIPKFETEYDVQMGGKLAKMGMPDAFNEYNADLNFDGELNSVDSNLIKRMIAGSSL